MYAHAFDGEGTVRRIGTSRRRSATERCRTSQSSTPTGARSRGSSRARSRTGAIPFMSTHMHITTPPTAFVSIAPTPSGSQDGMHVRLRVGGRFLPGRRSAT